MHYSVSQCWEYFTKLSLLQRGYAEDQRGAQLLHGDLHRVKERRGSHRVQDVGRACRQSDISSVLTFLSWETLSRCLTPVLLLLLVSKFNINCLLPRREENSSWNYCFLVHFWIFGFHNSSLCHADSTRCRKMKRIQKKTYSNKQRNGTEAPMSWQKPGKDKGVRSQQIYFYNFEADF